jgi:hypothetical protein
MSKRRNGPRAEHAEADAESQRPRSGKESVPPGAVSQHHAEHESGYGGRKSEPKTSANERERDEP